MSWAFEFDRLTAEEARGYYKLWDTAREAFPAMSEDELVRVVSLAAALCGWCHNEPQPCYCEVDD